MVAPVGNFGAHATPPQRQENEIIACTINRINLLTFRGSRVVIHSCGQWSQGFDAGARALSQSASAAAGAGVPLDLRRAEVENTAANAGATPWISP